MEAVQTFLATGNVVAEIDATMRRLHWGVVPQVNTTPSDQYPPSAAPGPDTPYIREYERSADASAPVAWLFTPAQAVGRNWELDLEVGPAEVPDHNC
jgi:hypothetical protein